jgi:hypothetical protein
VVSRSSESTEFRSGNCDVSARHVEPEGDKPFAPDRALQGGARVHGSNIVASDEFRAGGGTQPFPPKDALLARTDGGDKW